MNILQSIIGLLILIFGTVAGVYSGNLLILIISFTSGFLLISLSKLVDNLTDINHKLLGLPFTTSQLNTILKYSPQYYVESSTLDVYPDNETLYPLINLENELYIKAKVFYKYLSQNEHQYTFRLPEKGAIVLNCSSAYYQGVDLFQYGEQVLVKLSVLKLNISIYKDRLILK